MTSYVIKSPKATRVESVFAASGTRVARGQALLQLYSFEEQKILSAVERAIAENEIRLSEVSGPKIDTKLRKLQYVSRLNNEGVQAAMIYYEGCALEMTVGALTIMDVIRARTAVSLKSYMAIQAGIEADLFENNMNDAKKVLTIVADLLERERTYVEIQVGRLRISSPADGVFSSNVKVDSFVSVGDVLGTVS